MGGETLIRACAGCGHERHIVARGLCTTCYPKVRNAGKLDKYPRVGQIKAVHPPDWQTIAWQRKLEIDRLRARIAELEAKR